MARTTNFHVKTSVSTMNICFATIVSLFLPFWYSLSAPFTLVRNHHNVVHENRPTSSQLMHRSHHSHLLCMQMKAWYVKHVSWSALVTHSGSVWPHGQHNGVTSTFWKGTFLCFIFEWCLWWFATHSSLLRCTYITFWGLQPVLFCPWPGLFPQLSIFSDLRMWILLNLSVATVHGAEATCLPTQHFATKFFCQHAIQHQCSFFSIQS